MLTLTDDNDDVTNCHDDDSVCDGNDEDANNNVYKINDIL